jgi:hypothetical protein
MRLWNFSHDWVLLEHLWLSRRFPFFLGTSYQEHIVPVRGVLDLYSLAALCPGISTVDSLLLNLEGSQSFLYILSI